MLNSDFKILSNVVLSQDEIHAPYGGVVPELASRQHLTSIGYVVQECLDRARLKLEKISAFAVTQGPGLIGSLLVGLSFAKGLAFYFAKPLIGIDHLEAHIESAFLEAREIPFPVLALVVSGGHTSTFFMKKKLDYSEYGGAPLLGVKRLIVKAHGSSNSKAFKNAIIYAEKALKNDLIGKIEKNL